MRAGGLRLFREQPPRDLCQPRLVHRQPDGLGRLFRIASGASPPATGPGDFQLPFKGKMRTVLRLCRARAAERARRTATTARSLRPRRSARCRSRRRSSSPAPRRCCEAGRGCSTATASRDSFNPSFTYTDVKVETGSVDPKRRLGRDATISASTRGRSCCRRRITATISCGGTCGGCRRSGAA